LCPDELRESWKAAIDAKSTELATLRKRVEELEEELSAVVNAGHSEDCAGFDINRGECACGFLQRETIHEAIGVLHDRAVKAEALVKEAVQNPSIGIIWGESSDWLQRAKKLKGVE
jgi:hypothetical protein